MKIRYEWEASDIRGGLRVKEANGGDNHGIGFIVGYEYKEVSPVTSEIDYRLICLRDGQIVTIGLSKEDMAAYLTEHQYVINVMTVG